MMRFPFMEFIVVLSFSEDILLSKGVLPAFGLWRGGGSFLTCPDRAAFGHPSGILRVAFGWPFGSLPLPLTLLPHLSNN